MGGGRRRRGATYVTNYLLVVSRKDVLIIKYGSTNSRDR